MSHPRGMISGDVQAHSSGQARVFQGGEQRSRGYPSLAPGVPVTAGLNAAINITMRGADGWAASHAATDHMDLHAA